MGNGAETFFFFKKIYQFICYWKLTLYGNFYLILVKVRFYAAKAAKPAPDAKNTAVVDVRFFTS